MNNYIRIPNTIQSFNNTESRIAKTISGRSVYVLEGEIENPCTEYCFNCNCVMHVHSRQTRSLRHIPFGNTLTELRFIQNRYFCQHCHATRNQLIPFKAKEHFITTELESYAGKLLAFGLTNKEVSEITGLNKNIIKAIDLKRLKDLYTIDGETLIAPEEQARFLGVDEFKLHNGHKYATVIVNLENGHILWIAHGKKKEVVFSFIEHVGEEWMDGVEAVACDMNSELKGTDLRRFRKNIGMIFQHFNLLESKTVFQNIAIPLEQEHWKKDKITRRVNELLKFVELEDKAGALPGQLSGGQKQRVGIARALALNPEILLCDEATSALDPRTTDSILELIKKINHELNVTVLMITHQMNVIQQVCNKVAVLEKGQLVESGRVIDVFGNPQTETTKGFIRTVINDRLPESVKKYIQEYSKPQKVVRLRFDGKNADDPIMSLAIKETGVNISILYGTVTELEGKVVGFQTVQITGDRPQLEAADRFFEEHNVPKIEVNF